MVEGEGSRVDGRWSTVKGQGSMVNGQRSTGGTRCQRAPPTRARWQWLEERIALGWRIIMVEGTGLAYTAHVNGPASSPRAGARPRSVPADGHLRSQRPPLS